LFSQFGVAAGGDPQKPDEGASHCVNAAEPSSRSHLLEASIRSFQLTAGGLHAHQENVL
jgi:hypothetical protein